MVRSKPDEPRFTDVVPVRVEALARWVVQYVQAVPQLDHRSRICTLLGAAEVAIRTDPNGNMAEPTNEEKNLALYLFDQGKIRGYTLDEIVRAMIGAADGLALSG